MTVVDELPIATEGSDDGLQPDSAHQALRADAGDGSSDALLRRKCCASVQHTRQGISWLSGNQVSCTCSHSTPCGASDRARNQAELSRPDALPERCCHSS
jgi:hypothetical protein